MKPSEGISNGQKQQVDRTACRMEFTMMRRQDVRRKRLMGNLN